jgi:RNA polymerase sigma-70 factor (ECF subfamily)
MMSFETLILEPVRGGHADAFSEIVKVYYDPIKWYIFHLTGDYEATQDLAQETFLRAYENITENDKCISIKPWLYRIASNVVHNERKKISYLFKSKMLIQNNQRILSDKQLITNENMAVQDALLKVPEQYRVCLTLHFIEGFKYREIAETLRVSEESVRKRVARGKVSFMKYYKHGGR